MNIYNIVKLSMYLYLYFTLLEYLKMLLKAKNLKSKFEPFNRSRFDINKVDNELF